MYICKLDNIIRGSEMRALYVPEDPNINFGIKEGNE